MDVIRHIASHPRRFAGPVLTLGNFDGVHRGHQAILGRVASEARRLSGEAVALTFTPHPVAVLRPDHAPPMLTSLRHRIGLIADTGIEVLLLQRFTPAFAQLSPEAFVERFVVARMGARKVVVGHRVSFGHERLGDSAVLAVMGERLGFAVEVIGPVGADGHEVSSSACRRAIAAGEMRLADTLLGRPHRLGGRVVRGQGRGANIGFPTANLRVGEGMYPPDGVYAVFADTGYGLCDGIANIGRAPTFGDGTPRTLEVHLFDFDGDLYGRRCDVWFVERLRGEIRFPSAEALVAQIRSDATGARSLLARHRATRDRLS